MDTPLISSIRKGLSDDVIRELMNNEQNIDYVNSEGYTALMYLINLDPHRHKLIRELANVSNCNTKDILGYNILFIFMQGIIANQFEDYDTLKILKILVPNVDLSMKCGGIDILQYLHRSEKFFKSYKKRYDLYLNIEHILVSHLLNNENKK